MMHFLLGVLAVPLVLFLVYAIWLLSGARGGWGP